MTKQEAEEKLKQLFGFDDFFDNQWKTIERIFKGARVLLYHFNFISVHCSPSF